MSDISKFKDIESSIIIPIDFTIYFIIISFTIVIFAIGLYYLTKKKIVKLTYKQLALVKLQSIDFDKDNIKQIIYDFTIHGKESLKYKNKEQFEKILLSLEPYKYKKDIDSFDNKVIDYMKEYIKSCSL